MADIFLGDRKFVVGAAIADDLQALLDELTQRRAADASTPEGEPPPQQQPSLVPLVVGGQEVYVSEAAAPALQALVHGNAELNAELDRLQRELAEVQRELAEVRGAADPSDALSGVLDWMNATGHFVRADPDGCVRVYSRERPGRSPRGQLLRSHAVAILPGPGEE